MGASTRIGYTVTSTPCCLFAGVFSCASVRPGLKNRIVAQSISANRTNVSGGRPRGFITSPSARAIARLLLLLNQRVAQVVLVDVADVLHGLASDLARGNDLYVAEPLVRIETSLRRLLPQLRDSGRPRVVRRESEQPAVKPRDRRFGLQLIRDVAEILGARLDVPIGARVDALDEHGR